MNNLEFTIHQKYGGRLKLAEALLLGRLSSFESAVASRLISPAVLDAAKWRLEHPDLAPISVEEYEQSISPRPKPEPYSACYRHTCLNGEQIMVCMVCMDVMNPDGSPRNRTISQLLRLAQVPMHLRCRHEKKA